MERTEYLQRPFNMGVVFHIGTDGTADVRSLLSLGR